MFARSAATLLRAPLSSGILFPGERSSLPEEVVLNAPSPGGSRPQKTPTSSKSRSKKGKARSRAKSKPAKKPRARKRGERRSRVRLRRVVPGRTYFITKKTNDDQFFLRPDGEVNAVLLYILIERLNKYRLLLHSFVVMSNHIHLVVTDRIGKIPDFMREFLSETGKALKLVLNTTRRIWSPKPYSMTDLLDVDSAERFIVYSHVNPTNAGLTEPKEWPGLSSAKWKVGETIKATRPERYFDARYRADVVSCVLEPLPECFGAALPEVAKTLAELAEDLADNQTELKAERAKYRRRCAAQEKRIERRTAERVAEILERRKESKPKGSERLAGAEAVKQVSRQKRGTHPFGELSPRFASKDPQLREAAIEEMRAFLASHEQARTRYVNGEQNVLFPLGTYGYRERFGVRVRKAGAAA